MTCFNQSLRPRRAFCRDSLLLTIILTVWLSVSWAAPSSSVNDLLVLDLEELLSYQVTAPTKSETKLAETPGSVSLINYEQIRRSSARTIPELLRSIPGVNVRWNPMVQTIDIRAFGSSPFTSRVLLLIDGVPYNSWNKGGFPQHPGFDFFNLENVKHIEIIRGAGSALYGENALSGVINIVTLSGEEYRQTRFSVYGGDRNTGSVSLSHGGRLSDDASIFVSVRRQRGQLPSDLWADHEANAKDLYIKAKYKGLQASYYRRQDDFEGFDEQIIPPSFSFKSVKSIEQTVNIAALRFAHKSDSGAWSVEANSSYSDRKGSHCGACHAATQSTDFNKQLDHGYQLFGSVQLGVHNLPRQELLLGTEVRRVSSGDSFGSVPNTTGVAQVASYSKPALFVQDKINVIDDKLELVAGLRYDASSSEELFDEELFPRVMAIAKFSPRLTARAGWTKAARYPSFTELYQNIRFLGAENVALPGVFAFPPTVFLANPKLSPEYVDSLELGLEYIISDSYHAKVDVYQNRISDPLVLVYGNNTIGFENHPNDASVIGAELELKAEIRRYLSSYINWAYQHNSQSGGGVDSAGLPIEFSYSPTQKLNIGGVYRFKNGLTATLDYSWRDHYEAPRFWRNIAFGSPEDRDLQSYGYLNAKLHYRLPWSFGYNRRPISISFFAKNLGDERVYETLTGSGGKLVGREFFVAIDYELSN